jgi:intraflagellar transport protein 140
VKLSIAGDPEQLGSIWIGDCLLATSSAENMIRLWHLDEDENYVLTMFDQNAPNDKIIHIKYEQQGGLMVAGTMEGRVVMWKNKTQKYAEGEIWKVVNTAIKGDSPVQQVSIGNGLVAARFKNFVSLI